MTQRDYKIEFDSIVKEIIAPIFKELGFRKNANNFYRDLNSIEQVSLKDTIYSEAGKFIRKQ